MHSFSYCRIVEFVANGNAQSMAVATAQQQAQVAGAQPDYSKQWAEYYRSIGKMDEADAIENQIKTKVTIKKHKKNSKEMLNEMVSN